MWEYWIFSNSDVHVRSLTTEIKSTWPVMWMDPNFQMPQPNNCSTRVVIILSASRKWLNLHRSNVIVKVKSTLLSVTCSSIALNSLLTRTNSLYYHQIINHIITKQYVKNLCDYFGCSCMGLFWDVSKIFSWHNLQKYFLSLVMSSLLSSSLPLYVWEQISTLAHIFESEGSLEKNGSRDPYLMAKSPFLPILRTIQVGHG